MLHANCEEDEERASSRTCMDSAVSSLIEPLFKGSTIVLKCHRLYSIR